MYYHYNTSHARITDEKTGPVPSLVGRSIDNNEVVRQS